MLTYVAAALSLVMYILRIYYAHAYCAMLVCHCYCLRHAHLNIYACTYVSAASVYTSKLPPCESVVLNTMMQCSEPQVTSGDQSNGSSDTSALGVKLFNGE